MANDIIEGGGNVFADLGLPEAADRQTKARVFVCFHDGLLYAPHAVVKKTQQTPSVALALARKRMREIENG